MDKEEKILLLKELEPVIDFNVRRLFNYRMADYEDLMQEARMIIFEKLDCYNENKASLSTFCQLLIRNNLVCLTNKQYRNWDKIDINSEKVFLTGQKSEQDVYEEYYERLASIANKNSSKFRKIELNLIKLLLDGKTFKEIEKILDITSNYRIQLCFQIKKKIQTLMEIN